MSSLIINDKEYTNWLKTLKERYRNSQIKAASSVNREMLLFYWMLGKDIAEMKAVSRWGSGFFTSLSADIRSMVPEAQGFSVTNLQYIRRFYDLYREHIQAQAVPEIENKVLASKNQAQVVPDLITLEELCAIPWGHHRNIIVKCEENVEKAIFFVRKTLENNWSRAVLLNFLDTNLYERQGKAISNFQKTLPAPQSDLAQEMTKDPYNFDFLTITQGYYEKELKDALMDNIQHFLLELGTGFAFVGREYRLVVGQTEQFIDLLFYNIRLHCYVVAEVKARAFEAGDMGQIGTYVAAVDGILRGEGDGKTIGLLVCKTKDNVLAQYAADSSSEPIGISEFELSNLVPDDFKGTLPTIEEIERELQKWDN